MSKHNPNSWQNFDPWQWGYDDAMYDGIDTSSEMPCRCEACLEKYYEGREAALEEIFACSQSAQHHLQPTAFGAGTQSSIPLPGLDQQDEPPATHGGG